MKANATGLLKPATGEAFFTLPAPPYHQGQGSRGSHLLVISCKSHLLFFSFIFICLWNKLIPLPHTRPQGSWPQGLYLFSLFTWHPAWSGIWKTGYIFVESIFLCKNLKQYRKSSWTSSNLTSPPLRRPPSSVFRHLHLEIYCFIFYRNEVIVHVLSSNLLFSPNVQIIWVHLGTFGSTWSFSNCCITFHVSSLCIHVTTLLLTVHLSRFLDSKVSVHLICLRRFMEYRPPCISQPSCPLAPLFCSEVGKV